MATDRQIQANRRNSKRSTGPSEASRSRTRLNATKHAMASTLPIVEAERSPEFEERRAKWGAEQATVDQASQWALDRAVAASLQIERCEQAIEGVIADARQRASLAWEEDRAVEAATIFGRLARDPVLASRQLRTSLAGASLLIEAWLGLVAILKEGRDWSEAEAAMALDLLGVSPLLRSGMTLIDPFDDSEPIAFRLALAIDEVERLEALSEEALAPLEATDRRRALTGDLALFSKPAQLLHRYERDAWRRFRESMKELKATAPPPASVASLSVLKLPPAPGPAPVAPKPKPRPEPQADSDERSFEEERRAVMAEAASFLLAARELGMASPMDDEEGWFEGLERRVQESAVTERSQFAGVNG